MKGKQKAYSEEFRREAVRLAESGVKPLTGPGVSSGLGVGSSGAGQRHPRFRAAC